MSLNGITQAKTLTNDTTKGIISNNDDTKRNHKKTLLVITMALNQITWIHVLYDLTVRSLSVITRHIRVFKT